MRPPVSALTQSRPSRSAAPCDTSALTVIPCGRPKSSGALRAGVDVEANRDGLPVIESGRVDHYLYRYGVIQSSGA